MTTRRHRRVENFVWDAQTLHPGADDGDDGDSFDILFYPEPGAVWIRHTEEIVRTGAVMLAKPRQRRPIGSRPGLTFDDGDIIIDLPPIKPPKKQKVRIEIGPVGGPLTEMFAENNQPSVFQVPGAPIDEAPFEDIPRQEVSKATKASKKAGKAPARSAPARKAPGKPMRATKSQLRSVSKRVAGGLAKALAGAGKPGISFGDNTPKPPEPYVCRITNVSRFVIRPLIEVHHVARRTVIVTPIPVDRFESVFQGALRGFTPTISIVDGRIIVACSQEIMDNFPVPVLVDEDIGLDVDGFVYMQALKFDVSTVKAMWGQAFKELANQFNRVSTSVFEVRDLTDAEMNAYATLMAGRLFESDLAAAAHQQLINFVAGKDKLEAMPVFVDKDKVADLFEDLGIPRHLPIAPPTVRTVDHADDVVLTTKMTVDKIEGTLEHEVAWADATAEVLIEDIEARLYIQLGRQRAFREHPLANAEKNEPGARHYHLETQGTDLTWTSRFIFKVGEIEIDASSDDPIIDFGLDVLGGLVDAVNLEDLARDAITDGVNNAVRQGLADHADKILEVVHETVVEIADRDHELFDVYRTGNTLFFEHFAPVEPPFRPISGTGLTRRPLLPPIDGPMPADADARLARIDHIVVVMLENRSFDHMLGYLSHPADGIHLPEGMRLDLDGLHGNETVPVGPGVNAARVAPTFDSELEFWPNPDYAAGAVDVQIGDDGEMEGFIQSFNQRLSERRGEGKLIKARDSLDEPRRIMRCQHPDVVEMNTYLARQFCVLDRWFCSYPGPTYVNRMVELTGLTTKSSNGELFDDVGYLETRTLFEHLDRAQVRWLTYEGDVSMQRFFKRYRCDFTRIRPYREFFDPKTKLGPVTFVDPNVTGMPSEPPAEDDHPSTNIRLGQAFLSRVVRRLRNAPEWSKTMLIITYDEHGGFYDHVPPPGTTRFHQQNPDVSTTLTSVHPSTSRYGPRVPAFVVSPRVPIHSTSHQIYDHASIIRTILQRFAPDEIEFMPERVRGARHLGEVLQMTARTNIDQPPTINVTRERLRANVPGLNLPRPEPIDREDAHASMSTLGTPRRGPSLLHPLAKKTPAKKTPAKKTPAKKTPAKKTPAKKTPAKKAGSAGRSR
jgi:phospholipase C